MKRVAPESLKEFFSISFYCEMCFTTVWMSSRNIFMRSKGRIPSKKGPHNGAQVDRGGQQDGGKLRNTVTHGIVFTMNPTVLSHSATLIHFNHWFIRFCIIRFVFFFLLFHARRFLCVNDVLWFQLVAHCSSTTPASRASGLWESQLFHSNCTFWGNLCPLCSSALWEEVLQDL